MKRYLDLAVRYRNDSWDRNKSEMGSMIQLTIAGLEREGVDCESGERACDVEHRA